MNIDFCHLICMQYEHNLTKRSWYERKSFQKENRIEIWENEFDVKMVYILITILVWHLYFGIFWYTSLCLLSCFFFTWPYIKKLFKFYCNLKIWKRTVIWSNLLSVAVCYNNGRIFKSLSFLQTFSFSLQAYVKVKHIYSTISF